MSNQLHLQQLKNELTNLADAQTAEQVFNCTRQIDLIGSDIVFGIAGTLGSPDLVSMEQFEAYFRSAAIQIRGRLAAIKLEADGRAIMHSFANTADRRADDIMEREIGMLTAKA